MRPVVSILLPVRNEERHLPAALASLFRQTFEDWELVAVDDGSDDATSEILAAARRRDPRVRILTRPPDGLVAALNVGLEACRAALVARMDGDDIAHPSVMYRRETVLQAGGYRDRGWAEDYDLWLRLAAGGSRFARLPQILFFWRDRPERLTRTAPHCSPEAFRACKIHHLKKGFLREGREVTLWGAGQEGKAWRRALLQEGVRVVRWIDVDPRKIGQTIHGAPVVGPAATRPGSGKFLVTIGAPIARPQVRDWAKGAGLIEGKDFQCVT